MVHLLGQSVPAALSPDATAVVEALHAVRDAHVRSMRWSRISAVAVAALAALSVGSVAIAGWRRWKRR